MGEEEKGRVRGSAWRFGGTRRDTGSLSGCQLRERESDKYGILYGTVHVTCSAARLHLTDS